MLKARNHRNILNPKKGNRKIYLLVKYLFLQMGGGGNIKIKFHNTGNFQQIFIIDQ